MVDHLVRPVMSHHNSPGGPNTRLPTFTRLDSFNNSSVTVANVNMGFDDIVVNESSCMYSHFKDPVEPSGEPSPQASERSYDHVVFEVLKVEPDSFAKQITLIEMSLFRKIKREEFLSFKWNTREKMTCAPNIVNSTKWFNQLNFWVQHEILNRASVNRRAEMLGHFIRIAKHLVNLNNLYSAMAILTGLQVQCIYRLRQTWAGLTSREKASFRRLEDLFSQKDNYAQLREHLEAMPLPGIPYLGLILSDLTYINVAHGGNESVSQPRMDKINSILRIVDRFQTSEFGFPAQSYIQNYLRSQGYIEELQRFIEENNHTASYQLEPDRPASPPDSANTDHHQHCHHHHQHSSSCAGLGEGEESGGGHENGLVMGAGLPRPISVLAPLPADPWPLPLEPVASVGHERTHSVDTEEALSNSRSESSQQFLDRGDCRLASLNGDDTADDVTRCQLIPGDSCSSIPLDPGTPGSIRSRQNGVGGNGKHRKSKSVGAATLQVVNTTNPFFTASRSRSRNASRDLADECCPRVNLLDGSVIDQHTTSPQLSVQAGESGTDTSGLPSAATPSNIETVGDGCFVDGVLSTGLGGGVGGVDGCMGGGHILLEGCVQRKTIRRNGRPTRLCLWHRYWVQVVETEENTCLLYYRSRGFRATERKQFSKKSYKIQSLRRQITLAEPHPSPATLPRPIPPSPPLAPTTATINLPGGDEEAQAIDTDDERTTGQHDPPSPEAEVILRSLQLIDPQAGHSYRIRSASTRRRRRTHETLNVATTHDWYMVLTEAIHRLDNLPDPDLIQLDDSRTDNH